MTRNDIINPFDHLNDILSQLPKWQVLKLLLGHLFRADAHAQATDELSPRLRDDIGLPPINSPPQHIEFAKYAIGIHRGL